MRFSPLTVTNYPDVPWFSMISPCFSHDFPWNAEHIYANLCLGALSFSLFASRETFLLARSTIRRAVCTSFYVRWIANNNSHQRIQQTWGVHSFNKHEKFSCLKFGAEQTNLHGVSWCVNELILKDKSTKNWPIPKGRKWSIPCGMTFWGWSCAAKSPIHKV